MQVIKSLLSDRLTAITEAKSRLTTQHQVEAFEVCEMLGVDLKGKQKNILLRLAKLNLPVFLQAKSYMKGLQQDGYGEKVHLGYFLAMYKVYNRKDEK